MKTKFSIFSLIALAFFSVVLIAAAEVSDIDQFRSCSQCGMDRKAYGYSRMLISYNNGTQSGLCSLNCVVAELKKHAESEVKSLQVADRTTQKLVDAKTAVWVMGGNKRGVMTQVPKWAFATKDGAEAFIASSGGKISSWEETLQAARKL